jgi:hypothetical protein
MKNTVQCPFDLCTELCTVSSAALISAGLIAVAMENLAIGSGFILSGIAVGVATPAVAEAIRRRKSSGKR